jgi:ABC-type glycerol-3-phosphate transport system substrate-binding protein
MMNLKMTIALVAGLFAAACSQEPAAAPESDTDATAPAATAPADTDDDTLEPEAPTVEEGEEHNEDAPHSH